MIKTTKNLTQKCLQATLGIICGGSFWGLMLNSGALASIFRTTLTFDSPGTFNETQMIFDWEGEDLNGDFTIDKYELTDWSAELLVGNTVVYSEVIIEDGIVQDIGGVERNLSNILFEYSLDENSVWTFDNDLAFLQLSDGAVGDTLDFLAFGSESSNTGFLAINYFSDGEFVNFSFNSHTDETVVVAEPSLVIGLVALSGLMIGSTRKNRS